MVARLLLRAASKHDLDMPPKPLCLHHLLKDAYLNFLLLVRLLRLFLATNYYQSNILDQNFQKGF
jgi:hypothetical protein